MKQCNCSGVRSMNATSFNRHCSSEVRTKIKCNCTRLPVQFALVQLSTYPSGSTIQFSSIKDTGTNGAIKHVQRCIFKFTISPVGINAFDRPGNNASLKMLCSQIPETLLVGDDEAGVGGIMMNLNRCEKPHKTPA